jgi:O-antigen ligase
MKNLEPMPRRWETGRELISPSVIFLMLALPGALFLGVAIGRVNPVYSAAVAGAIMLVIILLLRLDELIVVMIIAVHILIDVYLNFDVFQVAMLMALLLLFACYFGRSVDHPWTGPRLIWLWGLFLILTIYPTIYGGAFKLTNSIASYLNLVLSAFIMFWLGNIIAKDFSAVRRVFQLLSILAALIAIHTIIEATTGIFLFKSASAEASLIQYSQFQAQGTAGVSRFGSFFINPNGNGVFLATSFFLPLGLFMESEQLWAKLFYLLESLLILLAVMFTYSTGSWISVLVGIVVFMFLVGRIRKSMLLLMLVVTLAIIASIVFPTQITAQLSHANSQSDRLDHLGTIQTAVRVIEAYPLFGVGLGDQAYLVRSNPYLSPAQPRPQAEPDNSYLHWGAMAGIPVAIVFLLLLGNAFWLSWRNWRTTATRYHPLLGGGIVALIALSINSLVVDGWTGPAGTASLGWLIAGIVSSPLIACCLRQQSAPSVYKTAEVAHFRADRPRMNVAIRGSQYERYE